MARLTKDAQIIKDNPGLTPYQLLSKGLSEAKYNELLKEESKAPEKPKNVKEAEKATPTVKPSEKLIPEVKPSNRALPKLSAHRGIVTEQARVMGPDGKVTSMLRSKAEKLARKNPKQFKLV